jgi:membrane-bound serine protease (ClpP class)
MILAFVEAKMEFLINANVSYVLLMIGVMLGFFALIAPGTGLLEVGALFVLALAGYGAYNLGINAWALVVLVLSIVPFVSAIRMKKWRIPLLVTTILMLVGGSIFMFVDGKGWPTVNPLLAVVTSLLSGGFLWLSIDRTLVAMHTSPAHNPNALVGQVGEARTEITDEGSVQVGGELWSARSETPIAAGSPVRVIGREGFVLVVEKVSK